MNSQLQRYTVGACAGLAGLCMVAATAQEKAPAPPAAPAAPKLEVKAAEAKPAAADVKPAEAKATPVGPVAPVVLSDGKANAPTDPARDRFRRLPLEMRQVNDAIHQKEAALLSDPAFRQKQDDIDKKIKELQAEKSKNYTEGSPELKELYAKREGLIGEMRNMTGGAGGSPMQRRTPMPGAAKVAPGPVVVPPAPPPPVAPPAVVTPAAGKAVNVQAVPAVPAPPVAAPAKEEKKP